MFCPNCAKENQTGLKFCRACGLDLEKISEYYLQQVPSEVSSTLLERKKKFEKLSKIFLNTFVTVGLGFIVYLVVYRYMYLQGAYFAGIGVLAMLACGLLGLYFWGYSNDQKSINRFGVPGEIRPGTTANLLEEGNFEPVSSVTEDTTSLLPIRRKTASGEL